MNNLGFVMELGLKDKVPGIYLTTLFGVGDATDSDLEKVLLLVGGIDPTTATLAQDSDVVPVLSTADADRAGPGSELARMAYGALKIPGIKVRMASASISSAVPATATITVNGTPTTSGAWSYRIGGVAIRNTITVSDTPTTIANAIAKAVNVPQMMVSAAVTSGVGGAKIVTLTHKTPGARGNDCIVWQDTSGLATGITSAIAGGSAVGNGGKRFHNGVGVEDFTTLLGNLLEDRYYRIAVSANDSVSLAAWRDQLDTKAGPLVGKMEHAVFAFSGTLSAGTSLAQTSLNEERAQLCWMEDAETATAEIAAKMAAIRIKAEQDDPNQSYDGLELSGVAPQTDKATNPNRATQVAALDVGLTPIVTRTNKTGSKAVVLRAITSRSLTASGGVDDGTLDVADSAVVDEVRDVVRTYWETTFSKAYKYVDDDPTGASPVTQPSGTATPKVWTSECMNLLHRLERLGWLTKVASNPVTSTLNKQASSPRIAFFAPTVRRQHQHQMEGTLGQMRFSAAA